jgi:hypothetical protein
LDPACPGWEWIGSNIIKMLMPVKADIDKKVCARANSKSAKLGKELDIEKYNFNILTY